MAAKVGKLAKVMIGATNVAGMGTWSMTGLSRETLEDSEFGDDVKSFVFGLADGGTVDFNGLYDPTDTTGQLLLKTAVLNGTAYASGTTGLNFYIDAASYWSISGTGTLLPTKCDAISMDKNGLGQISFSCKVSGTMKLT